MRRTDKAKVAACMAALKLLPIASRAILLMHRQEGLSYRDIARRLSLAPTVVEAYMTEALMMLVRIINGEPARRLESEAIFEAERALLERHRTTFEIWLGDQNK